MKRAILAAFTILTATAALAQDMDLALDAPITVAETTTQTVETSAVKIRYIMIDVPNQQVEIELVGIEGRIVHKLTNQQHEAIRTSFIANYGVLLKAIIGEKFTPPPQ